MDPLGVELPGPPVGCKTPPSGKPRSHQFVVSATTTWGCWSDDPSAFETPHHLADASRDRRKIRTLGGCSKGLEHLPTRHLSTHGAGWRASTGGPVGDAPPRAHHGSPVRRGHGFGSRVRQIFGICALIARQQAFLYAKSGKSR